MIFGIHCVATAMSPPLLLLQICERKSTDSRHNFHYLQFPVTSVWLAVVARGCQRDVIVFESYRCVTYFIMQVLQLMLLNIIICSLILYGIYNKVILSPV